MTFFEYLSVAVSIVLSISAAQILLNLRSVFDSASRYWVHAAWVVIVLLTHLLAWWGIWAYRVVESWTLATFALLLINPGVLLVVSSTLVDKSASESWKTHYFSIRIPFFAAFLIIGMSTILRDWILLDLTPFDYNRLPELSETDCDLR